VLYFDCSDKKVVTPIIGLMFASPSRGKVEKPSLPDPPLFK